MFKPYECSLCRRKFATRQERAVHEQNCTAPPPHLFKKGNKKK